MEWKPTRGPFSSGWTTVAASPFIAKSSIRCWAGIASGTLGGGDQLPTVRQVAVDLAVNPNTVVRAYRELEIRGVLETQQGTGTFLTHRKAKPDDDERQRQLGQLVGEFVARAGRSGFSVRELQEQLKLLSGPEPDRR